MSEFPNANYNPVALRLAAGRSLLATTANAARRRVPFACRIVAIEGGCAGISGTTVPSAATLDVLATGAAVGTTALTLLAAGTTTGVMVASSTPSSGFQGNDYALTATRAYLELAAGDFLYLNVGVTGTTNSQVDGVEATVWVIPK